MVTQKPQKTILVTGATGNQGGAVARRLIKDGWRVRALSRDPYKPASKALSELGIEVIRGDLSDKPSLEAALRGVYGIVAVLTPFEDGVEGEVRQGKNIAEAARSAGVEHFIYSSVAGADKDTGIPHFESKRQVEKYIEWLELPCTTFRPVFFTYNFNSAQLKTSILGGTLSLAIRPYRPLQMLAVEDFAEFVALALDRPESFMGRTLELAGDELTMTQTAEAFSRVLGRQVRYVEMPIGEVRKYSDDMAKMFEWFNENGYTADIHALRDIFPGLMSLETWLLKTGWDKLVTGRKAA